jgi:hypothetical protein
MAKRCSLVHHVQLREFLERLLELDDGLGATALVAISVW